MQDKYVLITGSDLTGKTTLINRLNEEIDYIKVEQNKGPLINTPFWEVAKKLMKGNPQPNPYDRVFGVNYNLFVNSLLFGSYLFDIFQYKKGNKGLLHLQDSYFERTMAVVEGRNVPYLNQLFKDVRDSLFQFDISILLTANLEAKKKRLGERGGDSMDLEILTSPFGIEKMDKYLLNLMKDRQKCLVIDTSDKSMDVVVELAKSHIEYNLKKGK